LLAPYKRRSDEEDYICGKCVYTTLNAQERAIYTLGREVGPFYEEIEMKEGKEGEYIAVVLD
jgi:hypothetical protein